MDMLIIATNSGTPHPLWSSTSSCTDQFQLAAFNIKPDGQLSKRSGNYTVSVPPPNGSGKTSYPCSAPCLLYEPDKAQLSIVARYQESAYSPQGVMIYELSPAFQLTTTQFASGGVHAGHNLSAVPYKGLINIWYNDLYNNGQHITQNLPSQRWGPWQSLTVRSALTKAQMSSQSSATLLDVPFGLGNIYCIHSGQQKNDSLTYLTTVAYSFYDQAQDKDNIYWSIYTLQNDLRTTIRPGAAFCGYALHLVGTDGAGTLQHTRVRLAPDGLPEHADPQGKAPNTPLVEIPGTRGSVIGDAAVVVAKCAAGNFLYVFYQSRQQDPADSRRTGVRFAYTQLDRTGDVKAWKDGGSADLAALNVPLLQGVAVCKVPETF